MAECSKCYHEKVCKYCNERVSAGTTVRETIHECVNYAPAANMVEVKHGKWRGLECNLCGHFATYANDYNYCPNCGAKMDGGKEE